MREYRSLFGAFLFFVPLLFTAFLKHSLVRRGDNLSSLGFLPGPQTPAVLLLSGEGIDINRADVDALELLPGIGPALAMRIVEDREARGPFRNCADIKRVRGIGEKLLHHICPDLGDKRPQ